MAAMLEVVSKPNSLTSAVCGCKYVKYCKFDVFLSPSVRYKSLIPALDFISVCICVTVEHFGVVNMTLKCKRNGWHFYPL